MPDIFLTPQSQTKKNPLVSMGGRAGGQACADPGARTPISAIGNYSIQILMIPCWLQSPQGNTNYSNAIQVFQTIFVNCHIPTQPM